MEDLKKDVKIESKDQIFGNEVQRTTKGAEGWAYGENKPENKADAKDEKLY